MSLDEFISPALRNLIEQRYYAPINQQSRLEWLLEDPSFSGLPPEHFALFSDHGVVHVRDVAQQVLACLEIAHGLLIPPRPAARYSWMQTYGVLVTYLHDIGMSDCSKIGRAVHPQAAAQALFKPESQEIIESIWQENSGDIVGRLAALQKAEIIDTAPRLILRELLAMSLSHSKSLVSADILNQPTDLRRVVQKGISIDLDHQYFNQLLEVCRASWEEAVRAELREDEIAQTKAKLELAEYALKARQISDQGKASPLNRQALQFYDDFERQSFAWLVSSHPMAWQLTQDVVDTLRILRCADALRQRGTVLKTSGSYEVFVDQQTANAVYALRKGEEQLLLLEIPSVISAGEANIASTELTPGGDVRVSFHRGSFLGQDTVEYAAYCAAVVLRDIKIDAIDSFERLPGEASALDLKPASSIKLLLEDTEDNPDFVMLVQQQMQFQDPGLIGKLATVPSLSYAALLERDRYLATEAIEIDASERQRLLNRIGQSGHPVDDIDSDRAFEHVKRVKVKTGETLVEAGATSTFVYVPMSPGLSIIPLGGYAEFSVQPWMPLGLTGVIRGAARNATVIAEREVDLLMIPKAVYLRHWHRTYTEERFRQFVRANIATARSGPDLPLAAKVYQLKKNTLLSKIETGLLMTLARDLDTVTFPAGSLIFGANTAEENLYLLLSGEVEARGFNQASLFVRPGDLFGDLFPFPSGIHEAEVTAMSDVKALRLSNSAFENLLESNGALVLALVQALSQQFPD